MFQVPERERRSLRNIMSEPKLDPCPRPQRMSIHKYGVSVELMSDASRTDTVRMFDEWAESGYSVRMENAHDWSVAKFLEGVDFGSNFSLLDVGCGNGWLVRRVAKLAGCSRAVGIDQSPGMIKLALSSQESPKESYRAVSVESMEQEEFDYAFSMESIYYAASVDVAIQRVYELLRPGGMFFCGTDFYSDNKATAQWAKRYRVRMHLLSHDQWIDAFDRAGFQTSATFMRNGKSRLKWMRECGTLFVIGKKPA